MLCLPSRVLAHSSPFPYGDFPLEQLRLLRYLYLTSLGPYVLMVIRMARDVARICSLGLIIVPAFALALHALFKAAYFEQLIAHEQAGESRRRLIAGEWGFRVARLGGDDSTHSCAEAKISEDYGENVWLAVTVLAELVVGGGDARFECIRESSVGWLGWWMAFCFELLMVLVLFPFIPSPLDTSGIEL